MQPFIDLFTQLQANLLTIAPIVAVCGVALWFLMNALAPVIPDWGQAARGYLQRILIGAIIVGAATTLVTAFMALGGDKAICQRPLLCSCAWVVCPAPPTRQRRVVMAYRMLEELQNR